jgi:hypothetical protein
MNVSDFFSSKYFSAADLNGVTHTVQIARVETETMQDGRRKPLLHFAGRQKALVCNKTNALSIASRYGPDMTAWVGRSIEMFSTIVQGPNGPVEGIRIRAVESPAAQQPQAAPAAQPVF